MICRYVTWHPAMRCFMIHHNVQLNSIQVHHCRELSVCGCQRMDASEFEGRHSGTPLTLPTIWISMMARGKPVPVSRLRSKMGLEWILDRRSPRNCRTKSETWIVRSKAMIPRIPHWKYNNNSRRRPVMNRWRVSTPSLNLSLLSTDCSNSTILQPNRRYNLMISKWKTFHGK